MAYERECDIARNFKTIDWLKAEMLGGVASLHRSLARGDDGPRTTDLANIVIGCYLLGKRLGISFAAIDEQVDNNIQENINNQHEMEKWYGDFSALLNHRKGRRK
ncbi:MAG: MazG-like family protein [Firmicutes bacterium]|nr:MazG-like family protein [Bacillota bacterium]